MRIMSCKHKSQEIKILNYENIGVNMMEPAIKGS